VIATYSTFAWENELRKKYQTLLTCSLIACVLGPLVLAMVLDYTVSQAIIFILAPFTPFISVLIDEWLTNRQNINVANSLTSECHSTWISVIAGKLSAKEIDTATAQHMNFWQNYRQTATPIFEWLYQCSQKRMEANMIIDTDELIANYINRPK
jgi:purine-cytosine permease-like protein